MAGENDLEVECQVMLLSNQIKEQDFSADTLAELEQQYKDYEVEKEAQKDPLRRDLRQKEVFSIDPATARDLDDALHIQLL